MVSVSCMSGPVSTYIHPVSKERPGRGRGVNYARGGEYRAGRRGRES